MSLKINKEDFLQRALFAIQGVLESYRGEMERYMKENAPWRDRTGTARQNLHASLIVSNEKMTITLGHGVEYGVYLEYAHGGKYAILRPTADVFREKIIKDIKSIFRR